MAKDLNEEILGVLSESVENKELRSFIESLLKFEAELSEVKSNRFSEDYDEMMGIFNKNALIREITKHLLTSKSNIISRQVLLLFLSLQNRHFQQKKY